MGESQLKIKCSSFTDGGWIPIRYTARGEDLSPGFEIEGFDSTAQSLAITLDDASHPLFPNYNHWIIWNIPIRPIIPEGIPAGKFVENLGGAVQGVAYGRNRYKGPKPPLKSIHTYIFTVYVLDCKCILPPEKSKKDFLAQLNGHILQRASLSGKFQSHSNSRNSKD